LEVIGSISQLQELVRNCLSSNTYDKKTFVYFRDHKEVSDGGKRAEGKKGEINLAKDY
jgi:hypothetical protein